VLEGGQVFVTFIIGVERVVDPTGPGNTELVMFSFELGIVSEGGLDRMGTYLGKDVFSSHECKE
jgi:hypothetical protein